MLVLHAIVICAIDFGSTADLRPSCVTPPWCCGITSNAPGWCFKPCEVCVTADHFLRLVTKHLHACACNGTVGAMINCDYCPVITASPSVSNPPCEILISSHGPSRHQTASSKVCLRLLILSHDALKKHPPEKTAAAKALHRQKPAQPGGMSPLHNLPKRVTALSCCTPMPVLVCCSTTPRSRGRPLGRGGQAGYSRLQRVAV